MFWILASIGCAVAAIVAVHFHRRWARPWRDLEQIVNDVVNQRAPRTFLVDGNAHAHRIGIALEDALRRQRDLEARAEEGELNVRIILDAMQDGLAVIDRAACVRLLNPALRRLFAIPEDRIGETVVETFRDVLIANLVDETLRHGTARNQSIKVHAGIQGDRQLAITVLPMHDHTGSPRGAVVLFQDVTQLQQLEGMRREFVSNVSHELRTPLSIFRGYLETLLDEPNLPEDERIRILRVIQKHSARLNLLAEDLLSLARLEAPEPQLQFAPLALPEFLRRSARDWEKRATAKQLRITIEADDKLPLVRADEARLEEVIHNLLDNAVKYSGIGRAIVIRAAHDGAQQLTFSVTDEGPGIAAADLPRIFERFYRADKARSRELGGTGLGLSIVKHIAQLHGGSVAAESQLGRGTTISVTLPVAGDRDFEEAGTADDLFVAAEPRT